MREKAKRTFQVPHTYTIIFILMIIVAVMTWVVPSGTFATNVRGFFGPMYDARDAVVERKSLVMRAYEGLVDFLKKLEPMADTYLVDGVTSFAKRIGVASRGVEGGDYRRYIGYIVIVLAISLILTVAVG